MANSIAFKKNYASIIDRVYKNEAYSPILNSDPKMVRAGRGAKEIEIARISVTGLGNYERNVGYKTGAIHFDWETKTFNYDRGIRLFADAMDIEETGIEDAFVQAGSELQRVEVAPEADAFTFAQIAGHKDVTREVCDLSDAEAVDVLKMLRDVTSQMDELEVAKNSRLLFITPTLKGLLDDYSEHNQTRSNNVLKRFSRILEVPQTRFYSKIDLLSGDEDQFGYAKAKDAADLNFLVVEKSAVIRFDKHVPSRIFSPDELEALDSHMMKYRKYGIVEVMDEKLDGIYANVAGKTAATPPSGGGQSGGQGGGEDGGNGEGGQQGEPVVQSGTGAVSAPSQPTAASVAGTTAAKTTAAKASASK